MSSYAPRMGMIRKTLSVGTIGLVDFKSDKERIAANTKSSAKQAKKQTKLMRDQAKSGTPAAPAPAGPPAGWYDDAANPSVQRWWDGTRYTEHTQPKP